MYRSTSSISWILSLALAWGGFGCSSSREQTRERPNILLIVADDLGYSDLGFLGSEIRTPNLDALAREGLVLTNFHVSPTCSPTRAMLLTGTDSHPAGLGTMAGDFDDNQKGQIGYEGYLSERVVSVASLLRDAGYRTCMAGKWHLGEEEHQGPHRRGFERSFVNLAGGASHFADAVRLTESDEPAPYREDGQPVALPENFYSTNDFTDRLIGYIEAGLSGDQPFFAFAAYTSPHWPLQVPERELDLYRGAYDAGWDDLRARRVSNLKRLGLLTPDLPLPPRLSWVKAWDQLPPEQRVRAAREMELYAAMVENLDRNIGRLLDFLKEAGQYEDTFILFFSDNGAEGNPIENLAGDEWLESRFDPSLDHMGRPGSYVFYSPGWASASTAPFRLFKAFPSEGGIRVPAIVRYRSRGAGPVFDDTFASVMDVAPTLLELAGTRHPGSQYRGRAVLPMQGTSLLAYLEGTSPSIHAADYAMGWELFGRRALLKGDWKLLWLGEPYGRGRWRLFNLADDPAESRDLADTHAGKLRDLLQEWEAYADRNGVVLPSRDMGYANEKLNQ